MQQIFLSACHLLSYLTHDVWDRYMWFRFSEFNLLIFLLFSKYLLSVYHLPKTVLDALDLKMSETGSRTAVVHTLGGRHVNISQCDCRNRRDLNKVEWQK